MKFVEFSKKFRIEIAKGARLDYCSGKVTQLGSYKVAFLHCTPRISKQKAQEWLYSIWEAFEENDYEFWYFLKYFHNGKIKVNFNKLTPEFIKKYNKFRAMYSWNFRYESLVRVSPITGVFCLPNTDREFSYTYVARCNLLEGRVSHGLEITNSEGVTLFIPGKWDTRAKIEARLIRTFGEIKDLKAT